MWHDVTPWERRRAISEAERHPLFRTTDPVTSRLAARQAVGVQADHHQRILKALELGPASATGIAARSGLDKHRVLKRLRELNRSGLIQETGRLLVNEAGRREREWRMTR
jgi:predicted Rossmann fold nucleotide-binding protein DprA/Smf involved in DNA uptake